MSLNQDAAVQISANLVNLRVNENFMLFLASVIEHNYSDTVALITYLQQPATTTTQPTDKPLLHQSAIDKLSEKSPFFKSVVSTQQATGNVEIISYLKATLQEIKIEWVFGMSFNDHEEDFCTLYNRNISRLILEQLDQKPTEIDPQLEPPKLRKEATIVKEYDKV